jgi:hypothetical protein
MKRIWLWIARFAYRRCADACPKPPDGLPFMRSPNAVCHFFEPRPREMGDFHDCQSDGHYLCKECCHLSDEPNL